MFKAEWTNKDSLDLQQTCNKLATNLQPTEGDIISREGAIECIRWGESVTDVIDRIKALPSADTVPQSEQYKRGFEDAKRAFELEFAREAESIRKRNAQLEVMLNAQKAISDDAAQGEWEHWGSPFSDESEVIDTIVCSVCGARFIEPKDEPKGEYNYCPNCGADMRSEKEYLDKTFPEHEGGEWIDITEGLTGGDSDK